MERAIMGKKSGNRVPTKWVMGRRAGLPVLLGLFLLAAVVLGAYLLQRGPQTGALAAAPSAPTAAVTIPIEGMSCAACVARVKQTLKAIGGVKQVEVRLAQRDARVRYVKTMVTPERLAAAINKLGYRAGAPKVGG